MASNYTEHYGLCQWEATDQVLRTDFNEDNAKLEEVLAKFAEAIELKVDSSLFFSIVDVLAETNGKLQDLTARVDALEGK